MRCSPATRNKLALPVVLLAGALGLTACSTSPTGRSQLMIVSPDQAISASKEAYTQTLLPLDKEGKVDSDPREVKRVREITGRVIAQAVQQFPSSKNWEWSIKVIDDPETVNAWCMAGGKMALYTGLVEQLKPSDDELAQVMAHEVAHALANHTAEKMSVAMATKIGMAGVAVAASGSKYEGLTLQGTSLAAAVAITLPNSRTAESEADRIGIELAARAGYDPRAAATLWQKMGATGGAPPEFMSTHPSPSTRQQTLAKLAPQMMRFYQPNATHPVYQFKD